MAIENDQSGGSSYVLVVDDHSGIRRFLTEWLSETGFQVESAVNGKECIEKIKSEPPALILLDIKMPVMGGLETLKEIGKQKISTSVIVMSAYTELPEILEASHSGMITHLIKKPFDLIEIRTKISEALG